MKIAPDQQELAQLALFQRRHEVSLLCVVCTELAAVAQLKQRLGDGAAITLLRQHEQGVRDLLSRHPGGLEVSSGNGAFFLVFQATSDALQFALALHSRVAVLAKHTRTALEQRTALHVGEVLAESPKPGVGLRALNGLSLDIGQSVLSAAVPGQILLTHSAFENVRRLVGNGTGSGFPDLVHARHGYYRLAPGLDPVEICEIAPRHRALRAPPNSGSVQRIEGQPDLTDLPAAFSETTFLQRLRVAQRQERWAGLMGGVVTALSGLLFLVLGALDGASYDWAYLFRRPVTPSEVVIVRMDEDAYGNLKQPGDARWDRGLHARLLNRLTDAGARAVGFDVLFVGPSDDDTNPTREDVALRDAFARNGRTVVADQLEENTVLIVSPFFRPVVQHGHAERARSRDSVIRQPSGAVRDFPELIPMVDRLAALVTTNVSVRPTDAWLNYYGPPRTIPSIGYADALSGEALVFSNRIVLVGRTTTSTGSDDTFASPFSRWRPAVIPGVEVHATSLLNLLRQDWLRRLPWWGEVLLVAAFGMGLGYGLVFVAPVRVLIYSVVGSVLLGAVLMVQVGSTRVWFPWLVFSAVQIPSAAIWAVAARTQLLHAWLDRIREFLEKQPRPSPEETAPVPPPAHAVGQGATVIMQREFPHVPDHRLCRCIGRGAYGEVWLAEDMFGYPKAVKLIRRDRFEHAEPFEREFRGLKEFARISLSHPGLVHLLHVSRNDTEGFLYYVMQVADDVSGKPAHTGEDYQPRSLQSDLERGGPLPLDTVLDYGIQIGEALAHLHQLGLIHRDLKPANLIFVDGKPKLADIGLVTQIAVPGVEQSLVGTPGYMPPEGSGAPSADVFGLGKVLYVAFSGRPAKSFPDLPDQAWASVGEDRMQGFIGVLLRACEPVVAERHQTAEELVKDLRGLRQATR